jgi:hypothetical protein
MSVAEFYFDIAGKVVGGHASDVSKARASPFFA